MYVYIQSESNLFTVGFYDPNGKWHTDSDHSVREEAAQRTSFMNGNSNAYTLAGQPTVVHHRYQPDDTLLEVVADIAFTCGTHKYFTDDSRADIKRFISWAKEFHEGEVPAGEYVDAVFRFTVKKMMDDPIAEKLLKVGPSSEETLMGDFKPDAE